MTELKPCPFCKCEYLMTSKFGYYATTWIVECTQCYAEGPYADTEEKAIELWNRRGTK